MTGRREIAIYGAGGFAREVAWLLEKLRGGEQLEMIGYIDDDPAAPRELRGRPVFPWERCLEQHAKALIAVAIGNPKIRQKVAEKCAAAGMPFATLVHETVEMSSSVRIGSGAIICAGSILTVDIEVEAQVHINLDCTVGHDVWLGEYATLAPGVHVSGNVRIGRGAYIGTGVNIINGTSDAPLVIGDGAVIGAGACVTRNVEPNCLYAGVPAELKKRYA